MNNFDLRKFLAENKLAEESLPQLDPRFKGPHEHYSRLIGRGNHLLSPADIDSEIEVLEKALEFLKSLPKSTKV